MMRVAASPAWLTPPQVAELLRVDPHKVASWIKSGELAAVNLATRTSSRPRWRISATALQSFLDSRQAQTPTPKARRRARTAWKEFL